MIKDKMFLLPLRDCFAIIFREPVTEAEQHNNLWEVLPAIIAYHQIDRFDPNQYLTLVVPDARTISYMNIDNLTIDAQRRISALFKEKFFTFDLQDDGSYRLTGGRILPPDTKVFKVSEYKDLLAKRETPLMELDDGLTLIELYHEAYDFWSEVDQRFI